MKAIPKIIHQTWKTENLPELFSVLAETWKEVLPDWEYILWTDEMNRDFVIKYFPHFLEKYDNYPKNIQRADAIRYLLLKQFGGLYVDLDFQCLDDNIESLLHDAEFVAGKEPKKNAQRYSMNYIICNAFMASVPNSSFINYICDRLFDYPLIETITSPEDVLNSTGPFLLTDSYKKFEDKSKIRILESKDIYPIGLHEKNKIMKGEISKRMAKRIDQSYAIHYFFSNW